MTKNLGSVLIFIAAMILTGCNGFSSFFVNPNPPGTGGGGTGTSTTSGYFYVLNYGTLTGTNPTPASIAGFQVVKSVLTAIPNGSVSLGAGAQPSAITVSPNNKFLYVSSVATGINVFPIGTNGSLGTTTGTISNGFVQSMQVDSTNQWLLTLSPGATLGTAILAAFPLNKTTGQLNNGATAQFVTLTGSPQQLVISPNNSYVFAAMGGGGTDEAPFNANVTNSTPLGAAVNIPLSTSGSVSANAVAVDPTTRFLYIAETNALPNSPDGNTGGLRLFHIVTSPFSLTEITDNKAPFASGGIAPSSILPDALGDFVYVANKTVNNLTNGNITGYSILSNSTGTNFSVTQLVNSPFSVALGIGTAALVEDSTRSFVISVNTGTTTSTSSTNADLAIFPFDTTNLGSLFVTKSLTGSAGTDPAQAFAVAAAH